MYTVYKITNKINNKIYIGSTNDITRRWREHKSHAFNPNCNDYNYPLQQAIRKYGLDKVTALVNEQNPVSKMSLPYISAYLNLKFKKNLAVLQDFFTFYLITFNSTLAIASSSKGSKSNLDSIISHSFNLGLVLGFTGAKIVQQSS